MAVADTCYKKENLETDTFSWTDPQQCGEGVKKVKTRGLIGQITSTLKLPCFEWGSKCDEAHANKILRVEEVATKYGTDYTIGSKLYVGDFIANGAAGAVYNVWKKKNNADDDEKFEITAVVKSYMNEKIATWSQTLQDGIKQEQDMEHINKMNGASSLAQTYAKVRYVAKDSKDVKMKQAGATEETLQPVSLTHGLLLQRYGYAVHKIVRAQTDKSVTVDDMLGCIFLYEIIVLGLKPLHVDQELVHRDVAARNILTGIPKAGTEPLPFIFYLTDFDRMQRIDSKKGLTQVMGDLSEALYVAITLMHGDKGEHLKEPKDENKLKDVMSWCEHMPSKFKSVCDKLLEVLIQKNSSWKKPDVPSSDPVQANSDSVPTEPEFIPNFVSAADIHEKWEKIIKAKIIELSKEGTASAMSKPRNTEQKEIGLTTEPISDEDIFKAATSQDSKVCLWTKYIEGIKDEKNLYARVKERGYLKQFRCILAAVFIS